MTTPLSTLFTMLTEWKKKPLRTAEHLFVAAVVGYWIKTKVIDGGIKNNLTRGLLAVVKAAPGGAAVVAAEQEKMLKKIEAVVLAEDLGHRFTSFPENGLPFEECLDLLKEYRGKEKDYNDGKAFGGIYTDDNELKKMQNEAYNLFSDSNALYPNLFPGLRKMEAEVVQWCIDMMFGDEKSCGTMTSGGTESILLAVKTMREFGKAKKGIIDPEMVVSSTTHAAFAKAAYYFGVKLVVVPSRSDTHEADMKGIISACNSNTIMVVGSAPTFPHGVIDPIDEMGLFCQSKQIPLHVDACLGGFLLPWLQRAGLVKKKFHFGDVPGVCSMSMDIHKYGYGPKGSSVVLYRNKEFRHYQYCIYTEWAGGIYCSPTAQGSRSGGIIAGAWASLLSRGKNGFIETSKIIHNNFLIMRDGVNKIKGLRVAGNPDSACVAILSDEIDVYKISDALAKKGWSTHRIQKPIAIMMQVGLRDNMNVNTYLEDLAECTDHVRNHPEDYNDGLAPVYGMAAEMPDRSLIGEMMKGYMDVLYKV
eukprot:TRINITY_DN8701_c0_g1_i1.p1 TRINITY_DN8701_c0_g1~~TRINITY_DN8701_c0_g1_i1.p1  ORF type:complete len:531 (-),score=181.18 TRINITY_DN8701_c0_g1_i1:158-1750(-)